MKIEEYRTCKYQYKTYWRTPDLIMAYGYQEKVPNPNTEKAFLANVKRKEVMEKR